MRRFTFCTQVAMRDGGVGDPRLPAKSRGVMPLVSAQLVLNRRASVYGGRKLNINLKRSQGLAEL